MSAYNPKPCGASYFVRPSVANKSALLGEEISNVKVYVEAVLDSQKHRANSTKTPKVCRISDLPSTPLQE